MTVRHWLDGASPRIVALVIVTVAVVVSSVVFVASTVASIREQDQASILEEVRSGLLCVEQQLAYHRMNTSEHHAESALAHGFELERVGPPPRPETLNPNVCAEHYKETTP